MCASSRRPRICNSSSLGSNTGTRNSKRDHVLSGETCRQVSVRPPKKQRCTVNYVLPRASCVCVRLYYPFIALPLPYRKATRGHSLLNIFFKPEALDSPSLRGARRPGRHGNRCARLTSILTPPQATEHAAGARHVSIANLSQNPSTAARLVVRAQRRSALRPDRGHAVEAQSPPT